MIWFRPTRAATGPSNQTVYPLYRRGVLSALTLWLGTGFSCGLAIVYFYSLFHSIRYPFEGPSQQILVAFRTALIATFSSTVVVWFAAGRKERTRTVTLRTALATQATLTLFAVIGFRLAIRDKTISGGDCAFPSTFFAEYNWLTFILDVAPLTSIAAALLMCLCPRISRARVVR